MGVDLPNNLVQYINSWNVECDFIVLGVNGDRCQMMNENTAGSVATAILSRAKTNVLVFK